MSTATTYTDTQKQLIPALRFKEFDGEWAKFSLNKLINDLQSGVSVNSEDQPIINDSEYGILKTSCVANGVFENIENKKIVAEEVTRAKLNPVKDEIIISRMNTPLLVGESGYIDKTYSNLFIPDRLWQTKTNKEVCYNRWLSYFLITNRVRYNLKSIATGTSGTMKNISKPNFLGISVSYPSLPEQQKIASFLSGVDEKIQQLTKKKELLEQYKKGVMQQLFSGQLRFKDKDGNNYPEWEEKRLGEVADRVTRKNKENNLNVLTISAQLGLVSQLEYFNKSVSAKDVTKYYLLEKDEFAYNKSYSAGYPMGAIKRLKKYDKGVVSTLYICFKFKKSVSLQFMEQYFEFGRQNVEIEKVAQEGARNHGLLNIGVQDFLGIDLILPSSTEQQKIATYLSSIDTKLERVSGQITQTQTFKKGLLQQMFV